MLKVIYYVTVANDWEATIQPHDRASPSRSCRPARRRRSRSPARRKSGKVLARKKITIERGERLEVKAPGC